MSNLARFNPVLLPRRVKQLLIFSLDAALIPISLWVAFYIRLGIVDPTGPFQGGELLIIILASIALLSFFRLYRIKLHSFDLYAIMRLASFSAAILALAALVDFFFITDLPRSLPILYGTAFFVLSISTRMAVLAVLNMIRRLDSHRVPVAIYGAGAAGVQLATALRETTELHPLFFVDDNPSLRGLIIGGLKVRNLADLSARVSSGEVTRVLIAIASLSATRKAQLLAQLSPLKCEVQVIPSYEDLISGTSTVSDLKPVTAEELLNRDKVELDIPEVAKTYAGRSVMVTGAGGSIGSELCRQLLNCSPRKIVLYERGEHVLYEIDRVLRDLGRSHNIEIVSRLASVTDRASVEAVVEEEDVEIIIHAAAYKHVPLVESNEVEGTRNNVMGTQVVAEVAAAAQIERFILVSTDKAVRPTNIMGATKRMAELVVQDIQSRSPETKFSMVRFGNVLGSSGSVVPLFQQQIARGGPVTVTHDEVMRYFMTIPEAARLVLIAGTYSEGSDLFVLDMGRPVKIIDLARRMIEMSGRSVRDQSNPDGDIEIAVTDLRPGEKLYEELLFDESRLTSTPHEKILRTTVRGLSQIEVAAMLKRATEGLSGRDPEIIRQVVEKYVDGYGDAKVVALQPATEAN